MLRLALRGSPRAWHDRIIGRANVYGGADALAPGSRVTCAVVSTAPRSTYGQCGARDARRPRCFPAPMGICLAAPPELSNFEPTNLADRASTSMLEVPPTDTQASQRLVLYANAPP